MHQRFRWAGLILLSVGLCAGRRDDAGVVTCRVSGTVTGGSGKHTIHVALWDAAGFLAKPMREIRIEPGTPADFHFDVPAGRWALSAYEDENGNGKLDMGLFGPKEPSGFWRPFHGWHKPRFDEVAEEIDQNTTGADIRLGK